MGIFERCLMQNCMCFQGAISVNRRQLASSLDFDFTISRSLSDFNCAFVSLIYSFFFFSFLSSTCKGAGQWECTAQDCDGMYKLNP